MAPPGVPPVARGFLVVRVATGSDGGPEPRLALSDTYAADGGVGSDADARLVAVAASKHFCFPEFVAGDCTSILPAERLRPEQFAFGLTEGDGTRTLGFCRRFLPPGVGPRYPLVACILTKHAWDDVFFEILARVDDRVAAAAADAAARDDPRGTAPTAYAANDRSHVASFLRGACARAPPAPGKALEVPIPWYREGTAFPSVWSFAPPGAAADGASSSSTRFAPLLFQGVTPDATLALFAALLHERRVVLSGSDPGSLSAAVRAAAATLAPARWQHVFVPLLPHALLDVLTAPVPFLVGLPSRHAKAFEALPTEEVFHLDLDSGTFVHFPEDLDAMPTRPTRELRSALARQMRAAGRFDDDAVGRAFRTFMRAAFGAYARHARPRAGDANDLPESAIEAGGLWLDWDGMLAKAPTRRSRALLDVARHSQWFEVFARERLAAMATVVAAEASGRDDGSSPGNGNKSACGAILCAGDVREGGADAFDGDEPEPPSAATRTLRRLPGASVGDPSSSASLEDSERAFFDVRTTREEDVAAAIRAGSASAAAGAARAARATRACAEYARDRGAEAYASFVRSASAAGASARGALRGAAAGRRDAPARYQYAGRGDAGKIAREKAGAYENASDALEDEPEDDDERFLSRDAPGVARKPRDARSFVGCLARFRERGERGGAAREGANASEEDEEEAEGEEEEDASEAHWVDSPESGSDALPGGVARVSLAEAAAAATARLAARRETPPPQSPPPPPLPAWTATFDSVGSNPTPAPPREDPNAAGEDALFPLVDVFASPSPSPAAPSGPARVGSAPPPDPGDALAAALGLANLGDATRIS